MTAEFIKQHTGFQQPAASNLTYGVSANKKNLVRNFAIGTGVLFLAAIAGFGLSSEPGKILSVCFGAITGTLAWVFWNKLLFYRRYRLTLASNFIEYQGTVDRWRVELADITNCSINTQTTVPRNSDTEIVIGKTLVIATRNADRPEAQCPIMFPVDSSFAKWFANFPGNVEGEYQSNIADSKPDQFTGLTPEGEININKKRAISICKETVVLFALLLTCGYSANWYLGPHPEQLRQTYAIEGRFDYYEGSKSSASSVYTDHRRIPIYCGLGLFGDSSPCGNPKFRSKNVLVELVQYKSIFGRKDTVVSLSTADGSTIFQHSAEQLASEFQGNSRFDIKLYSILASLFYFLLMMQFRTKFVRRYNYY